MELFWKHIKHLTVVIYFWKKSFMTDVGVGSKYAATKFGEVLQQII